MVPYSRLGLDARRSGWDFKSQGGWFLLQLHPYYVHFFKCQTHLFNKKKLDIKISLHDLSDLSRVVYLQNELVKSVNKTLFFEKFLSAQMRPRMIIFICNPCKCLCLFSSNIFFLPMPRVTALVLFHGLGLCLVPGLGSLTSLVLNMTKRATSFFRKIGVLLPCRLSVFYPSDNKN